MSFDTNQTSPIERRSLLRAGAWAAPAVTMAAASPAHAGSPSEIVHTLSLAGATMNQTINLAGGHWVKVEARTEYFGGMDITPNRTNWEVKGGNPFGVPAAWVYQRRNKLSGREPYSLRGWHTVTLTASPGAQLRDFELTVARLPYRWAGTSTNQTQTEVAAIAVSYPNEVVVVGHGSNLSPRSATNAVPAHHEALWSSSPSTEQNLSTSLTTSITLRRPGAVGSISFDVWNKAQNATSTWFDQTFNVGALKVTQDL